MPFIYRPKGRALEYAELALNIYGGRCTHNCLYGYCRDLPAFKDVPAFPRPGLLDGVRKEAQKYKGQEVLCSFTCDPFQNGVSMTPTIKAVQALLDGGCNVALLTKAGRPTTTIALRHFAAYADRIRYGATLTFDNDRDSREWEPGADTPDARIEALRVAHAMWFKTWVSFEPVIDPVQTLHLMRMVQSFVDHYKIGRWNHDPRAEKIDWLKFALDARAQCEHIGKHYTLKNDLAKLL